MQTVEDYLAEVGALAAALPVEEVPLAAAHGRVLAAPVASLLPVPPFTNSAMDGYAVRSQDVTAGAALQVAADIPAGATTPAPLPVGHAARIMTGAPLPEGADSIVPVELTDQPRGAAPLPDQVIISEVPVPGRHVRREGENVSVGDRVLMPPLRLGPAEIAAAASAGHATVPCRRAPRVAVLVTGDELTDPAPGLPAGMIPDSNGPLLTALLQDAGAALHHLERTSDDPDEFAAAFGRCAGADLVVTSGGASVGAFDVVTEVLTSRGVRFRNVAMQPGKPQGAGIADGLPTLSLPGNPVSVFVSFHVIVRPFLAALAGAAETVQTLPLAIDGEWTCPPGRRQYTPVAVDLAAGTARLLHRLGSASHLVASLAGATGLAVSEGRDRVTSGTTLPIQLLSGVAAPSLGAL